MSGNRKDIDCPSRDYCKTRLILSVRDELMFNALEQIQDDKQTPRFLWTRNRHWSAQLITAKHTLLIRGSGYACLVPHKNSHFFIICLGRPVCLWHIYLIVQLCIPFIQLSPLAVLAAPEKKNRWCIKSKTFAITMLLRCRSAMGAV